MVLALRELSIRGEINTTVECVEEERRMKERTMF
jgi:hypothetical protein